MPVPPEVWLRGPVDGVLPVLQPAAHAILQAGEDVLSIVADLSPAQLWARPGGAAAIGYHLLHVPGSLDRLLTYSRGDQLTPGQLSVLAAERSAYEQPASLDYLTSRFSAGIDAAITYLRTVPEASVFLKREVGRQRLPSTTLGLIFHAAEHAARHAGQIVTLRSVVGR
jgi:uncharacterized damage-inducible protein DinB